MKRHPLVVFLGPSLPAAEARRIAPCTVLPPARQGDVWRALAFRPAAIALIDGVFESTPSVWHHEILDALDAGVPVFGGASMGALRAAELAAHGMIGVGRIYEWYRRGIVRGDDEVALLHGGEDSGFRPLTVPLVAVRDAAQVARAAQVLTAREARALVNAAQAIFYQDRTWPRLLRAVAPELRPAARSALGTLLRRPPDPKADDARATIEAAAAFARSGAGAAASPPVRRPSSLVRRRKLAGGVTVVGRRSVASAAVLESLGADAPRAAALRAEGLRHALLASFARTLGVEITPRDRRTAAQAFFARHGVPPRARAEFLAANGLDDADAARFYDDLARERALLASASRAVPDGPSGEEGLAAGARLSGGWAEAARHLLALPGTAARRRSRRRAR